MTAAYKEITKFVTFDINGQAINGYSVYTKVIPIDRDDWDVAFVTLWNKNQTGVTAQYRRLSGFLVLTTDYDDGYSQASEVFSDIVYPYPSALYYTITNHKYKGFSYAASGVLSAQSFDTNSRAVRVDKGKINGSNLELDFYNTYSSTHLIQVQGVVKLGKTVLL